MANSGRLVNLIACLTLDLRKHRLAGAELRLAIMISARPAMVIAK